MNFIKCLVIVFLIVLISGCSTLYPNTNNTLSPTNQKGNEEISEFSLIINEHAIDLGKYEDQLGIESVLGKAISEDIKVLGSGADTFTGSFLKKSQYNGLEITLMSPKGDGKRFWILDMKSTSPMYKTKKGIKVGDSVSDILNAYPETNMASDGRTDKNNCGYVFTDNKYDYIWFEVKDGTISEIRIYKELP